LGVTSIPDEKVYAISDSWWNPRFEHFETDQAFRVQSNQAALPAARTMLGIILVFWCGFIWFDQFLSPESRTAVLFFRFMVILPAFLVAGAVLFSRMAGSIYQGLIVAIELAIFAALIRVVFIYDDFTFVADRVGLKLSMSDQNAKYIFTSVWIMVIYVASLAARIRTGAALWVSIILILSSAMTVYVFQPEPVFVALMGPFVLACIPAVFMGALMMQRHAVSEFRSDQLMRKSAADLENSLELLKRMFGRYISTDVMRSLLSDPSALELGGERRRVSIMMTDLRGFTSLSERLEPEQVVQMLNVYFEVMVDVVLKHEGLINEIIGDAMLVIFGALHPMPDRAERAVACALDMQNAIKDVNVRNSQLGLPELKMGIGLNDAEVIVGNIGSSKRTKYAAVGSGVNMASRIESYTVGGQVLISESLRAAVGDQLRIDGELEVYPKGAEAPMRIYEVGGIAGNYNLALAGKEPALSCLAQSIGFSYTELSGGEESGDIAARRGIIRRLSRKNAEVSLEASVEPHVSLKMNLEDSGEGLKNRNFYGKVIGRSPDNPSVCVVCFTAVPPEVATYFLAFRKHAELAD